ncbi:MAG: N-acetyltransferase family protein [Victivallaceae bacterium]|jgi:phosphinothricin acetyltransferase
MKITGCSFAQAPEILAIINDAIINTTALYDYKPRTMEQMKAWFEAKKAGGYPVLGAFEEDGTLAGFASYGAFRAWPAYKYSIEHSVYIQKDKRGRGLGKMLLRALIETAKQQNYHMMIGGIDSTNLASIKLHHRLGFAHCASIKQAGYKFGRWLDLEFYQLILPTPETPAED